VAGIIVLVVFQLWMTQTGRLSSLVAQKNGELRDSLVHPLQTFPHAAYNTYATLLYLGLFLSPVTFCVLAAVWTPQKKKAQILFAVSLWVLLAACFFYSGDTHLMPLAGNILEKSGIGPVTLRDAFFIHINSPPILPVAFWKTVTIFSAVAAAALVTLIGLVIWDAALKLRSKTMTDNQVAAVFLVSATVIYLGPILITTLMDRYLMLAIPLMAAAIVGAFQPLPRLSVRIVAPATAVLAGLVFFSVCTTRDYLTWNRARWSATNNLMAKQHFDGRKMDIDGGFEFNGLYFFNSTAQKNWWTIKKPAYIISFGPVAGYTSIEEHPYSQWLPPCTRKVMVLKIDDTAVAKN
jgi:hypothetical protein